MKYIHIDVEKMQSSYHSGDPCGDVINTLRLPEATYMIFTDGCGHGTKANITANYISSRLKTLIAEGQTMRQAFEFVVKTVEDSKGRDLPYCAMTLIKILNNGETTILTYEMPHTILTTTNGAEILAGRTITMGKAVVSESFCYLEPGDSLLTMSDGITDSGIGTISIRGWGLPAVKDYLISLISSGKSTKKLPKYLHSKSRELWGASPGDDCTVVQCFCRPGETVTILTGPPSDKKKDRAIVNRFLRSQGKKIVCGATTSKLIATHTGEEIGLDQNHSSMISPPKYMIKNIDLATEGAVTLNQAYNIIGESQEHYEEISGVTELCKMLHNADSITFMIGAAQNKGHEHISFIQRGIMPRHKIVPKLAEKLREMGKLVVVEEI